MSLQVLGVTLIAAAIIIPASTARLLTNNFHKMFILSIIISIFTSIAGIYASFYLNAASGATIVLLGAAIFTIVLIQNYIHRKYWSMSMNMSIRTETSSTITNILIKKSIGTSTRIKIAL